MNNTKREEKRKIKFMNRTWTPRKIAFISILIATATSFILVFSNVIPIAALPTFKISLGGLPVKLTGYIFGPVFGMITGILGDLISYMFRPTYLHYWYTLSFALAGIIPGIIGYFFNRKWRQKKDVDALFEEKYNYTNFAVTLVILISIIVGMTIWITEYADAANFENSIVKDKYVFLGLTIFGFCTMIIGMFVFRFKMTAKKFNSIIPIIAFSALLEINTLLSSLGDQASGLTASKGNEALITVVATHLIIAPAKIWTNLIVINFAYNVVSPLIFNKTSNGW